MMHKKMQAKLSGAQYIALCRRNAEMFEEEKEFEEYVQKNAPEQLGNFRIWKHKNFRRHINDKSQKEVWFKDNQLHRIHGYALIDNVNKTKSFYIENTLINDKVPLSEDLKWNILRANAENIFIINYPSKGMLEYVLKIRPDLASQLEGKLDESLLKEFGSEVKLSKIEI
jgi:hypothetical protein